MLFRQFCAPSARSRPLSSTRTSFSASAKVTAETSGPTAGAVPKAGGVPAGGGACVWASSFGATTSPTSAADDVTRKLRRDFDMMFSKPRIVAHASRQPARKLPRRLIPNELPPDFKVSRLPSHYLSRIWNDKRALWNVRRAEAWITPNGRVGGRQRPRTQARTFQWELLKPPNSSFGVKETI